MVDFFVFHTMALLPIDVKVSIMNNYSVRTSASRFIQRSSIYLYWKRGLYDDEINVFFSVDVVGSLISIDL